MNGSPPLLPDRSLRVGSWPGRSFRDNAFIQTFCDVLEHEGFSVTDIRDPRRVASDDLDILHIHWPEQIFWSPRSSVSAGMQALQITAALSRLKSAHTKLVWMVHNLAPHDASHVQSFVWNRFSRAIASRVDGVMTLSPATLEIVKSHYPFSDDVAASWVRHPTYGSALPLPERDIAQQPWELPAGRPHFVFVGAIRPYKGIVELAEAVAAAPNGIGLTVAGSCDKSLRPRLESASHGCAHLRFVDRRLSDREFNDAITAADYVVLPFRDSLHSGSIIHALSLGRPVVTVRTPYTQDLAEVIGSQWLVLCDTSLSPGQLAALPPPPMGMPDLTLLSPATMGRSLRDFYEALVSRQS